MVNIHPALLPSFQGAHGIEDAYNRGVKVTGVTVHFANEVYDQGPIIAQEIVPLELNEENNKPKVFEVMVPNSRFSQGNMARLATVLTANPGGDRVEIFIEQVDGRVLRAEVPAKVNARSIPLLAEAKAIVGNQGRVTVI